MNFKNNFDLSMIQNKGNEPTITLELFAFQFHQYKSIELKYTTRDLTTSASPQHLKHISVILNTITQSHSSITASQGHSLTATGHSTHSQTQHIDYDT